ncbi:MAG: flagellar FliJ family protein [Deltaproteobacteria bacterium]|nr:flagellar FliJ family protein [Deltaproteobacteria bacterium]
MTRWDRLIRQRQRQRDEAAQKLATEQRRLAELEAAQAQAVEENRDALRGGAGGRALTVTDLERLDLTRRMTEQAATTQRTAVGTAKDDALKRQKELKQIEVVQEKGEARERVELRRKEQRALDEVGRGTRKPDKGLLLLVPLFAAGVLGGCEAWAADEGASKKAHAADKQGVAAATDGPCQDLKACGAEVRELRRRVEQALGELRGVRERLARQPSGADATAKAAAAAEASRGGSSSDLVQVVRRMSVRPAGAMLAEMDAGRAAWVLRRLPADHTARLLAALPAEKAAAVGERLMARPARSGEGSKGSGASADADEDDTPAKATSKEGPDADSKSR